MTRYVDTAEQAKLIRHDLKHAFPATKFSVKIRRYSMGSSVDVTWTDGPTTKDVEAITNYYDSHGMMHIDDYVPMRILSIDGEQVHFMGSVSCARNYSREFYTRQLEQVCKLYRIPVPRVEQDGSSVYAPDAWQIRLSAYVTLRDEMYQKLQKTRASDCRIGTMPIRPAIEAIREV